MPMLYLVRHGRAAAGWDKDVDPGLDELGTRQAHDVAKTLAPLGPLDLVTSPMARTRETSAPLAREWACVPRIEQRVTEIPSGANNLAERGSWLREIATRNWAELDPTLRQWRTALLQALSDVPEDTVVVTHFIAINAAVGAAIGNDRVVHFHPDYCSVTTLRNDGEKLELVHMGDQGETRVL